MDIVVNGDIFIMKRPEYIDISDYLDQLSHQGEILRSSDIRDVIEYFEIRSIPDWQIGDFNYFGMRTFWQIFANDDGTFSMISCEFGIEKKYNSKDDLEEDFISVSDFLERANFIGRKFRRYDEVGVEEDFYDMLLYAMDDIYLVRNACVKKESLYLYYIIPGPFFQAEQYEYYGPVHGEYANKEEMYKALFDYCSLLRSKGKRNF